MAQDRRLPVSLLSTLLGLVALVWFLVRVVPKPSRAAYPCQRAAFPLASAFVLWLSGLVAVRFAGRRLGAAGRLSPRAAAGLTLLGVLAAAGALPLVVPPRPTLAASVSEGPNQPMGTARGLHPGRVTWIRDTSATPWDGATGHWWDDTTGIRPDVVDRMFSQSLRALTGAATDADAWDRLFRYSNQTRGRGDAGYAAGEKIAFKINVNNAYAGYGDDDNQIDASPQAVLAVVRQLVRQAGVPEDHITVYEAVRVIPARIFDRVHGEFPNVVFVDSQGNGTNGRQPPDWQEDVLTYSLEEPGVGRALPRCVTEAAYLINQSLLKGHPTTGFTGCAKNHYGSVTIRDHKVYVNSSKHPMGIYHPFVDMIGSNALGGKTVLFMTDALYGIRDVNDVVGDNAKWAQLFEGQWMASLLLSQDPIAIDSVIFDFLSAEFPAGRGGTPAPLTNADNFLHEGARADDPPSGTFYRPNGARLASLGVHEHWNNPSARQYTRNLGTGPGIELFRVTAGDSRPAHARRFVCADYTQGKVFLIGPDGEPVWEREAPRSNDLAVLPNGNVLFTTGHGVRETTPDGVVVFRYDSDHEVYGCQRLPDGNTLVGDSTAGRLLEVDPHGTAVKSLSLLAPGEEGGHAYMRNARKLASGHYLVALFRDQRVREYDGAGKVVWEAPAPGGAHSVERLPDGHTLVTTGDRGQREPRLMELDAGGAVVWQVSNEDLPGRPLRFLCGFHRLANGNIVVANWLGHGQEGKAPLLLEISPKKEVVWSYARHDRLRTASSVFVLDAP